MALADVAMCTCPMSFDPAVCAKCGGKLLPPSQIFSKIDLSIQQWFYDLDFESRLNSTLGTYMAIDKQVRQGTSLTVAVQHATKEIGLELTGVREELEQGLAKKFDELRGENERFTRLLQDGMVKQMDAVIKEIKLMSDQGKSISEIESRIREATGALQTFLTAMRLPGVKGEEAEISVLRDLHDAFLGQSSIKIEPIGGADATDAIVKFFQDGIEIGRSLVEVKARKTWSNEFIGQVREDMKRYNAPLTVLTVDKLPRTAKGRGFHVDTEVGIVIITPPELVVPTVTMFFEIHASSYKLRKKTLDLESIAGDRNLAYYLNDNMKILDDCKKISDLVDDSARKVKEHATSISSRLRQNNGKIAKLLSTVSDSGNDPSLDSGSQSSPEKCGPYASSLEG